MKVTVKCNVPIGNFKAIERTETIYKGIAEFFTRYGFTVKQHGIGFQITF